MSNTKLDKSNVYSHLNSGIIHHILPRDILHDDIHACRAKYVQLNAS